MRSREEWIAYVKSLRGQQDKLREELKPLEEGTLQIGSGIPGSTIGSQTKNQIATIKGEIASLEKTIQGVISEQGLPADA